MRYVVVYEGSDAEGWSAYVPDLDGCVSVGDTFAEVQRNIRTAIGVNLRALARDGEPFPEPSAVAAELVEVEQPVPVTH